MTPHRNGIRRLLWPLLALTALVFGQDDFLWPSRFPRAWAELRAQLKGAKDKTERGDSERVQQAIPDDKLPMKSLFELPGVTSISQRIGGTGSETIVHGNNSPGFQAETSVAINSAGTVMIAGFNDLRGFSLDTAATGRSISGVARSVDGGNTWVAGPAMFRNLPVLPALAGGAVFGDPDVKYDPVPGHNRWIYSSIYLRPSDGLEGMCVHVSSNDGQDWQGPFEVTPTFQAGALADKEFIDINPTTGRILMAWTQVKTDYSIRTTYSDDSGRTWSPAQVVSPPGIVTGGIPRFYGAANAAYLVWRTFIPGTRTRPAGFRNIGFARSADGGQSWSAAVALTFNFPGEDEVLGVDRTNTNPSMAVDQTNGNIYLVYQVTNATGEGDIAFQRSTNGGANFSAPILLNGNPGNDRAQFFPDVAVDQTSATRRVHVVFYDQGAESSGDVLDLMHMDSDDGGLTWSPASPLLGRSFHAGYGNDTSQPNLGDYIQNVARNGTVHVVAAATSVQPQFDERVPPIDALITPDSYYDRLAESDKRAALRLDPISFNEVNCPPGAANGKLDPGETADLSIPLRSYTANGAAGSTTYTGVSATLTSTTAGVAVVNGTSAYPDIGPLQSRANTTPFRIALAPNFTPGRSIDLLLSVTTAQGSIARRSRLPTGTPGTTVALLFEDFENVPQGSLPEFWSSVHQAPATGTPVPWTTSTALTPSNAAFHVETGGPSNPNTTKWERLFSPLFTVPTVPSGGESYVSLDFDIAYSLEDETTQKVLGYDGLTLRLTDATVATNLRSVLAEAFAESITQGNGQKHFPKHLPRSDDKSYFEDMSVWSGYSNGPQRVSMRFPGAGMRGRRIQLRWEYTEDDNTDCREGPGYPGPCGVALDNIVLKHVVAANGSCLGTGADLAIGLGAPELVRRGTDLWSTITVTNVGPQAAADVVVNDSTPAGLAFVSNSGDCATPFPCQLGAIAAGQSKMIRVRFAVPVDYLSPNPIQNTATVSASTPDLNPDNNSSSASTTLSDTSADLEITATGPTEAKPGKNFAYTLKVRNNGPTDASDVSLVDNTPNNLFFVVNVGACTSAFPCNLGIIRSGETKTINATYLVPPNYILPNPIADTASVTSSTFDPDLSNNSVTIEVPVLSAIAAGGSKGCGCNSSEGLPAAALAWVLLMVAHHRRRVPAPLSGKRPRRIKS